MADTDENSEVNTISQKAGDTPLRTSSSEDPDQDTPTTSTEGEEATSAEPAPVDNAVKHTDKIQQLDISLKNLEAESKKLQDTKNENKDGNKDIPTVKDDQQSEDSDDDEDEEAVLESSPCGRWHKRKEQVRYRDVPGIDVAYLAMDSEEGVEVVWNEARFTSTKKFKAQEENMKNVFEALTTIDHPNIVKFHKYWIDYGPILDPKSDNLKDNVKKIDTDGPNIGADGLVGTSNNRIITETSSDVKQEGKPFNENKMIERMDSKVDKDASGKKSEPRLIFITEYMSSGSLKQFLRKTKKNNRRVQVQSWKRWCIQILSALNHLHTTCDPPIVHGNLNCDTIFIQHNGLVKIGSVAPDIIHHNVKTCRDSIRNLHFFAPEWGEDRTLRGQPIDIYAFGMAALETAALDIQATPPPPNGANKENTTQVGVGGVSPLSVDGSGAVTEEAIQRTIDQLEDDLQKDFIRKCLNQDPDQRPSARSLLFHPVLFEVHSLKLLAAHVHVNTPANTNTDTVTDEAIQLQYGPDTVIAIMRKSEGKDLEYKYKDFSVAEKLGKFMEDVKFGIYPITAFALSQPAGSMARSGTEEDETSELYIQNTVEAPANKDLITSGTAHLEPKTDTEEEQETDEESEDDIKEDKNNVPEVKPKTADDDLKEIEYVTNLKILSCLLHMGPPVPRIMEYAVCVYRLQNSMNRQASTWVSTRDTPIKLAISLMEEKALKSNMVITYAAMFTRGFIQRSREIDEFWEHYMRYEEQKCKSRNEEFKRQSLPIPLKVHQSWLINVAKHYGFLDDRPGINDKHQAPEGMVWVHDSDYNAAVAWLLKHQEAMQVDPPKYYYHPDYLNAPWMEFEKRLNGEPLVPVKQKNNPMEQNWPPWSGPLEEYDHDIFPEDTPGKKLLGFLMEERNKNPVVGSEEVPFTEENGPQIDMINVLKAEVERVHYQYETQHGHGIVHSLDMAGAYSNDCIPMPVAPEALSEALRPIAQFRDGLDTDSAHRQVTEEHLNQLMAEAGGHAPAAQLRRALEAAASMGGTVRVAGQLPGDFGTDCLSTVSDTELDVVPMGPIEVDPLMSHHENAMVLAQQFKHLPQLIGNQKYVVVPETEDGQTCPPMFLDNDQLVHLQAMANAQAHFVVQQQSSNVPSEGHVEEQQDQQQGNYFNPYLQENYEPYPYYQGINQDEVTQYGGGQDFPVFRGQMFSHQGHLNLDGRIGVQDISGVCSTNDNNTAMGAGANAMVSSPSVEEELAQLQIADSDSDEPKHHKADIAAAAITSMVNNDPQVSSPIGQDINQDCRYEDATSMRSEAPE